jgi:hypothetical protein
VNSWLVVVCVSSGSLWLVFIALYNVCSTLCTAGGGVECASEGVSPAGPERISALLEALRLQRDLYPHLSDAQFNQLECLIVAYHDVFALTDDVIGCVPEEKGVYHTVPTSPDMKPIHVCRRGRVCTIQCPLRRI